MKSYATVAPQLRSMISRAAHLNWSGGPTVVTEKVGEANVSCIGHHTIRNTLDGYAPTVMIRWKIDGKAVTKRAVYERFGLRKTVAN